jgi:hypothetical protein
MEMIRDTCNYQFPDYSKPTERFRNWIYSCSQITHWGGTYCLDQTDRATINHLFSD